MSGPEDVALLERFRPVLRYDSRERFFADRADRLVEAPGVELRRGPTAGAASAVIARSQPVGTEPRLTLAFLGPKAYANGEQVLKTDVIGLRGKDYVRQYRLLCLGRPEHNDHVYGRAAIDSTGRTWVQYWLAYFYNPYRDAAGIGKHEGDWESVQYRMAGDRPDVAVYAQHRRGEQRAWPDVPKDGDGRPVVFVARDTHAAYFAAGYHWTREAWLDTADGRHIVADPALTVIDATVESWMRWPGRWGDSVPRGTADLEQASPSGPGSKRHWRDPAALLRP